MRIERTYNSIRNMAWGYVYRLFALLLPFAFRTIMINKMGADYLGVNSLFSSLLQVLNLSELGFGIAVVYSMYKPIAENNWDELKALLAYFKRIYFIVGLVILILGLLLIPAIRYLISGEYPSNINIYIVYFMFLLNSTLSYWVFGYKGALLNAHQRADVDSKILLVFSVLRYGFEILSIYVIRNYYVILVVEIGVTVFTNISRSFITNRMYPDICPCGQISKNKKSEIRKNVIALMYHKVGMVFLTSADSIVISAFMGVVAVANYNNYFYVVTALESIVIIGFSGVTAGIGNSIITESKEKNSHSFWRLLFFNAWLVGWFSICLLGLYQDFIHLWVGEKYMLSSEASALLVVFFYFHNIRRTMIAFRDGIGVWNENKYQPLVSSLFNLIVNIVLINLIGICGVIISSIISLVLIDIPWEATVVCNKLEINVRDYFKRLIGYSILVCLVGIVAYLVCVRIEYGLLLNLIIKGIVCTVLPNAIFYILFKKTDEFSFFCGLIRRYFGS